MCKYNNLTEPTINLVKNYMNGMPHYEPNTVSELALLLYNSIITSVNGISDYTVMKEQSSKENHVNENIQKLKSRNTAIDYPYDKEKELIDYVQEGETEKAAETMVSLLNTFSILEVCDLDSIRNRTLWLFAIILRATDNQENNLNQFLNADTDVIDRLGDASSFDELQKTAVDLIRTITGNMITSVYHGQSQIIMRALQYVNKNYLHKISLKDIERELNVNGSYFSTLFKKEMGITFTRYVNHMKIANTCRLLTDTNMSIIEISMASGFDDQSYFTKAFSKEMGMTPNQYRARHR